MALIIMPIINYYGDLMERMSPVNHAQMDYINGLSVANSNIGLSFTSGGYKDAYFSAVDTPANGGGSLDLLKEDYNNFVDQLKAAETAQFFQLA